MLNDSFLYIEFDDVTFAVPVSVIAKNKADYYVKKIKNSNWKEEYDFMMNNEYNIVDWASNNMDWEDVAEHAVLIDVKKHDYKKEWINAKMYIKE